MKVEDAGNRLQLEQPKKPADVLLSFAGDLVAEVDQERLIARALESRQASG